MSSPKSSSSATAGRRRSSRPRPLRRSTLTQWSAAAVTAAALYAFPWTLVVALAGGFPLYVAVDVAVLVVVALRLWSPVVVLGASLLSLAGALAFFLITASAGACGASFLADLIGVAAALVIGAWGVRRGPWAFAAIPAGWILAGGWFVLVAHGGTGGCFE